MRKVLVLLLVVGLLVGTLAVVEVISQDFSTEEHVDFTGEDGPQDNPTDPTPCGGGSNGDGGIPG